jgi:hypothetical protein
MLTGNVDGKSEIARYSPVNSACCGLREPEQLILISLGPLVSSELIHYREVDTSPSRFPSTDIPQHNQ